MGILVGTVLLVYFDRDGYVDNNDLARPGRRPRRLDLLHDRHPEHDRVRRHRAGRRRHARLINAFIITPARIAFLVLLIGTTLEVLASQGRDMIRVARWRKNMGNHVVVVGYGTKGRSAVETLDQQRSGPRAGPHRRHRHRSRSHDAHADGLAVVMGDATRRERAAAGRGRPAPSRSSSPPTATTPTCSPR